MNCKKCGGVKICECVEEVERLPFTRGDRLFLVVFGSALLVMSLYAIWTINTDARTIGDDVFSFIFSIPLVAAVLTILAGLFARRGEVSE